MLMLRARLVGVALCAALAGCAPSAQYDVGAAISEVNSRTIQFKGYPKAGMTYLSFSAAHGFQVTHLAAGATTYLWYPGNLSGLTGDYKRDTVGGRDAMCWRYGPQTYNPVTKTRGGQFACQPMEFTRKTIVAQLSGDPFNLASGRVPYRMARCTAPREFSFDRDKFTC